MLDRLAQMKGIAGVLLDVHARTTDDRPLLPALRHRYPQLPIMTMAGRQDIDLQSAYGAGRARVSRHPHPRGHAENQMCQGVYSSGQSRFRPSHGWPDRPGRSGYHRLSGFQERQIPTAILSAVRHGGDAFGVGTNLFLALIVNSVGWPIGIIVCSGTSIGSKRPWRRPSRRNRCRENSAVRVPGISHASMQQATWHRACASATG